MSFSKYRGTFLLISLALGIFLYSYMMFNHGSFARSIAFNGGIRLGVILPKGMTKADLEASAEKSGLTGAQIRIIDTKSNQYDLDLGPEFRDKLAEDLKKSNSRALVTDEIESKLIANIPNATASNIVSRETISASYGSDLARIALWSFIWTVVFIGAYLTFRFDFPFALGASLALVHDIVLTIGFIGMAQIEPSIPVLAAVLTIVGYSINDTIVIFDRIRETTEDRAQATLKATMDYAITKTLSRTVITSLLTLISVLAILLGGADSLKDFALVLIFGIVVGTYSSIFIASHFVQYYEEFRYRLKSKNISYQS